MLATNHAASHAEKQAVGALDYACRMLVNTAKENAPYRDRSSQLRNGYGHRVVDVGRDNKVGVVFNRMNYAPKVEFTPGYWVLSAAFIMKRAELLAIVGKEMDMSVLERGTNMMGIFNMSAVVDRFKGGMWVSQMGKGRSFQPASFIGRKYG